MSNNQGQYINSQCNTPAVESFITWRHEHFVKLAHVLHDYKFLPLTFIEDPAKLNTPYRYWCPLAIQLQLRCSVNRTENIQYRNIISLHRSYCPFYDYFMSHDEIITNGLIISDIITPGLYQPELYSLVHTVAKHFAKIKKENKSILLDKFR